MNTRRIVPTAIIAFLSALPAAQSGRSDLRVSGKFISDLPTGDPPLQVNSTTNVPNLNADKLDGFDVGDFATAGSGAGVHYKNLVGVPGGDIDQDCAVNTGCFAGDAAGFPVTISEPGSYRLIGNLETSDPNQTLIFVNASGAVLVDLKGFNLRGPASCSGSPASCTGGGSGFGIESDSINVAVRNGSVQGMGSDGVNLASGAAVRHINASRNAGDGIDVAQGSRVSNSITSKNGEMGIDGAAKSVLTDNVAEANGGRGISTSGTRLTGNTGADNGGDGIVCGGSCVVTENLAEANSGIGLNILGRSTIKSNTATDNGSHGISNTFASGLVLDNVATDNGGYGLNLRGATAYARNMMRGNSTGSVNNGTEIGTNFCGSDTTCP